MNPTLSPTDIQRIVSQPSELRCYATNDEYEMEKFERVAREAVATYMADTVCQCIDVFFSQHAGVKCNSDCRACWREALKREGR